MFNFKKADFEGLRTALRNDPPENYLDNDSNINDDWSSWKIFLFDKLGTFIPKRITRKFVSPPWIDGEVTHAIRKKNTLHKRAKQNPAGTRRRFDVEIWSKCGRDVDRLNFDVVSTSPCRRVI